MRKLNYKNLFLTCSLLFLSLAAFAGPEDMLEISNTPQCAADMKSPTKSIFLAVSFRDMALVLKELAPQIGKEPVEFIKEGNRVFKVKLNLVAQAILQGLASGQLPYITQKNDSFIKQAWSQLDQQVGLKSLESMQCYEVNDINSYYSELFIRGVNTSTLEQLARQYKMKSGRLLGCSEDNITANTDFYPVYNYDLKVKDAANWEQHGFDFWISFKIYLSWAWRNWEAKNQNGQVLNEGIYHKVLRTMPIEEQVVLLSNGCRSVTRPECNSDFLSSTELRSLFSLDRKKLALTSSTLEMRDNIVDNNDALEDKVRQRMADTAKDNEWIRSFQKALLAFTQDHKDRLYQANVLMSSLAAQKGLPQFLQDLQGTLNKPELHEELYYMCSEVRLIGQEKPFSVFKFDLEFMRQQSQKLDGLLHFGLSVQEMVSLYGQALPVMLNVCDQYDASLGSHPEHNDHWKDYKGWYKNYLSRYKILDAFMNSEDGETPNPVPTTVRNYVQGLCADPVDCGRNLVESVVDLNRVILHAKTFLRNEVITAPIFSDRAEKVACGMYDPWESSRLNKKKLFADIGGAALFGWTGLPIYLDLNFKPKELVSMNKLIEDGHVKFDLQFDRGKINKSLALNFGSFLNVPCSVNLSEEDTQAAPNNQAQTYVFSGLSVNACKANQHQYLSSPDKQIDSFKKTPDANLTACGQCAINFQQVGTMLTGNAFAPLRFIIRLAQGLMRYSAAKDDDSINPHKFNINSRYLVETYDKHNSIPPECVPMLTRGLRCQANICEALAVREFEVNTGLEVASISLTQDDNGLESYNAAWIKVKGCSEEVSVPFRCQGKGDGFFMGASPRTKKWFCKGQAAL